MSKRPTSAASSDFVAKRTRNRRSTSRCKLKLNFKNGDPALSSSGTDSLGSPDSCWPSPALRAEYLLGGCNVVGSLPIDWGTLTIERDTDGTCKPVSSTIERCSTPKDAVTIVSMLLISSHAALFARIQWITEKLVWEAGGKGMGRRIPILLEIRNYVKALNRLLITLRLGSLHTGPGGGGRSFGRGPIISLLRTHFLSKDSKIVGKFVKDWLVWNWCAACAELREGNNSKVTITGSESSGKSDEESQESYNKHTCPTQPSSGHSNSMAGNAAMSTPSGSVDGDKDLEDLEDWLAQE